MRKQSVEFTESFQFHFACAILNGRWDSKQAVGCYLIRMFTIPSSVAVENWKEHLNYLNIEFPELVSWATLILKEWSRILICRVTRTAWPKLLSSQFPVQQGTRFNPFAARGKVPSCRYQELNSLPSLFPARYPWYGACANPRWCSLKLKRLSNPCGPQEGRVTVEGEMFSGRSNLVIRGFFDVTSSPLNPMIAY